MNDQCLNCNIRKWCYREEPEEDWTCDYYKSNDEYVDRHKRKHRVVCKRIRMQ